MSIVASLKSFLNGHTVDKIASELARVDMEIATRRQTIAEGRASLREAGAMARMKGEPSPDRRAIRDAEDALEDLEELRSGLAATLEESQAADKAARIASAWKRIEDRREALKPLRAVLYAMAALMRHNGKESGMDLKSNTLPPRLGAYAESALLGGSDHDIIAAETELRALGVDPSKKYMFGGSFSLSTELDQMALEMIPTLEKAIQKAMAVDFVSVRKVLVDPAVEAGRLAKQYEDERAAIYKRLTAEVERIGSMKVSDLLKDKVLFDRANDVLRQATYRDIPCAALTSLCANAYATAHGRGDSAFISQIGTTNVIDSFGTSP